MNQNVDDAVKSRLTGSLEYTHPNRPQAQNAWERLLRSRSVDQQEAQDTAIYLSKMWSLDFRKINATLVLADTLAKARQISISRDLIDEVLLFKGEKPQEQVDGTNTDTEGLSKKIGSHTEAQNGSIPLRPVENHHGHKEDNEHQTSKPSVNGTTANGLRTLPFNGKAQMESTFDATRGKFDGESHREAI